MKVDVAVGIDKAKLNTNKENRKYHPYLNKDSFRFFKPNDVINYDNESLSAMGREVFKHEIRFSAEISKENPNVEDIVILSEIDNGIGWNSGNDEDILNTFYYRYDISYIDIIIILISICFVYIVLSYKNVRCFYEIIISFIIAIFYTSDISGGEKFRKILHFIKDTYILIVINIFSLKIFFLIASLIGNSFDGIFESVFILFTAFAVMDGASVVQRILGMDAGLGSSLGKLFAIYGGGKFAVRSMLSALGAMRSGLSSVRDSIKESKEQDKKDKDKAGSNLKDQSHDASDKFDSKMNEKEGAIDNTDTLEEKKEDGRDNENIDNINDALEKERNDDKDAKSQDDMINMMNDKFKDDDKARDNKAVDSNIDNKEKNNKDRLDENKDNDATKKENTSSKEKLREDTNMFDKYKENSKEERERNLETLRKSGIISDKEFKERSSKNKEEK